ncbi:hypothetical protein [Salinicoccus albus]|uniref:hypothetical protein n=1 Tax=Salinicoccus albus TaxID=418756 RepID=UPI00036D175E|nr:hypothetical protein [Salinicoccus albus]
MYFINGKFNSTFRDFDLYKKLGIISVNGRSNEEVVSKIAADDIIALFSTRSGYLGAGRVMDTAVPIDEFKMHQGGRLIDNDEYPFKEIARVNPHFKQEEFVIRVEWLYVVPDLEDGMIDDDLFVGEHSAELLDDERTKRWLADTFSLNINV